jgi:hypothetical protein
VPPFNPAYVQALEFKEIRMGITMWMSDGLLAPFKALFGLRSCRGAGKPLTADKRTPVLTPPGSLPHEFSARRIRRPLRIVHGATGRMVISGRMADVCAELERLAALEAAAG